MKDTEFFERALGLTKPWEVKAVRMDVGNRKVEIEIECTAKTMWFDAETEERLHIQGYEKRRWRHLDTMQFETVLIAEVPRVKYPDGHTENVKTPWADRYARFTQMFEGWAIQVLRGCVSLVDACELLGLDWSAAHAIMKRAVERGMARRELEDVTQVGMDEKSFRKGQSYVSIMTDLQKGRVLEVEEGRDEQNACDLWEKLPAQQREKVEAVAMDMSGSYAAAAQKKVPQARIVNDRFHVSKLLNTAVSEVRRKEHKELHAQGDDTLSGTRFHWLFNPKNLTETRFEEMLFLTGLNLKTSRAWMHKEDFEEFWNQETPESGQAFLDWWLVAAVGSNLAPIQRVARTLKAHAAYLLNYFYFRITNAVSEGLNSKIQGIKSAARGFRSFANYRIRILFFCGKLDFTPASA
jgi:transposase